jgi:hypothetical protein
VVKIKHKSLIIVLAILFFVCIISFLIVRNRTIPKSFEDLLGTNDTKISNILLGNGNSGTNVTTNDKTKIKELITLVNNRYYRRSDDQRKMVGYNYFYTFYVGNKDVLTITYTGTKVYINRVWYEVNKEISSDKITDWFNSLTITK